MPTPDTEDRRDLEPAKTSLIERLMRLWVEHHARMARNRIGHF